MTPMPEEHDLPPCVCTFVLGYLLWIVIITGVSSAIYWLGH